MQEGYFKCQLSQPGACCPNTILVMIGNLDSGANDHGQHLDVCVSLSRNISGAWDSSVEELELTMVYSVCQWVGGSFLCTPTSTDWE